MSDINSATKPYTSRNGHRRWTERVLLSQIRHQRITSIFHVEEWYLSRDVLCRWGGERTIRAEGRGLQRYAVYCWLGLASFLSRVHSIGLVVRGKKGREREYRFLQLDGCEVRGGERPSESSISDKRKLIWQQRKSVSRAPYFSWYCRRFIVLCCFMYYYVLRGMEMEARNFRGIDHHFWWFKKFMICFALGNFGATCLICLLALVLVFWRRLFYIIAPKLGLPWDKSFSNKQLEKCVTWYCYTQQHSVDNDAAVAWCTPTAVMRSTNEAGYFFSDTHFR